MDRQADKSSSGGTGEGSGLNKPAGIGDDAAQVGEPSRRTASHIATDTTDDPGARGRRVGRSHQPRRAPSSSRRIRPDVPTYAALDLGTNNCRLLVAQPARRGFHVIDAFSRIIRLGEGLSSTGLLSEAAMSRTKDALRICGRKIWRHQASRVRLVATEACRKAANASEFISEVHRELNLELEILSREDEARLAVSGCAALIDPDCDYAVVFDIGGGSSEIVWLDLRNQRSDERWRRVDFAEGTETIVAWTSLPAGVVTLAERYGGESVTNELFEAMVADVTRMIEPFEAEHRITERVSHGRVHMIGTSGTVTTLAGIMLGLERYDRNRVDGSWMSIPEIRRITGGLLGQSYAERVEEPCIGRDRADLVLAGCAILEALIRAWPVDRLRVADRGLREGILTNLMADDGHPVSYR